jgi:hypothetical protein
VAADEIFVLILVLVCVAGLAILSMHSRRQQKTATERTGSYEEKEAASEHSAGTPDARIPKPAAASRRRRRR